MNINILTAGFACVGAGCMDWAHPAVTPLADGEQKISGSF